MLKVLSASNHIHCIGIGGSGLSGLACLLQEQGYIITGSDEHQSHITENLIRKGINVFIGHSEKNIGSDVDLVIFSSAIPKNNIERQTGLNQKIEQISYPKAIGLLTEHYKTIAVCGTHGKTTTTGMASAAFIKNGTDPTVIIGSPIKELKNQNYKKGSSPLFILEACEYQRAFLNYKPYIILITNIEPDHLDYYQNFEDYQKAFGQFIENLDPAGFIIANADDETVTELCRKSGKKIVSYGRGKKSDYTLRAGEIYYKNQKKCTLSLQIPGDHNRLNALAAFTLCSELNLDNTKTARALNKFHGAKRRFELKGRMGKTMIIDDYGHHPTEIKATLQGLREKYGKEKKVICVFQPHQYNRTHKLLKQFTEAFNLADEVVIPNIYKARDQKQDMEIINEEKFVQALQMYHTNVRYTHGLENTQKYLQQHRTKYDIIITMGAGDVGKIAEALLKNA